MDFPQFCHALSILHQGKYGLKNMHRTACLVLQSSWFRQNSFCWQWKETCFNQERYREKVDQFLTFGLPEHDTLSFCFSSFKQLLLISPKRVVKAMLFPIPLNVLSKWINCWNWGVRFRLHFHPLHSNCNSDSHAESFCTILSVIKWTLERTVYLP